MIKLSYKDVSIFLITKLVILAIGFIGYPMFLMMFNYAFNVFWLNAVANFEPLIWIILSSLYGLVLCAAIVLMIVGRKHKKFKRIVLVMTCILCITDIIVAICSINSILQILSILISGALLCEAVLVLIREMKDATNVVQPKPDVAE